MNLWQNFEKKYFFGKKPCKMTKILTKKIAKLKKHPTIFFFKSHTCVIIYVIIGVICLIQPFACKSFNVDLFEIIFF
jgi:hypothetical protein